MCGWRKRFFLILYYKKESLSSFNIELRLRAACEGRMQFQDFAAYVAYRPLGYENVPYRRARIKAKHGPELRIFALKNILAREYSLRRIIEGRVLVNLPALTTWGSPCLSA